MLAHNLIIRADDFVRQHTCSLNTEETRMWSITSSEAAVYARQDQQVLHAINSYFASQAIISPKMCGLLYANAR